MKLGKKYYYEWYDHYARTGWISPDDVKQVVGPLVITGLGWLVHKDKQHYVFTQGIGGNGMCNDLMVVMKSAIKKTKRIK